MVPNDSKMNKNHPFWVRTHFGYFKPWFEAIVLLFYHSFLHRGYPRPPWSPVVLPGAPMDPWSPHDPWYVILDHCQSSWVIMSPIWPIWSKLSKTRQRWGFQANPHPLYILDLDTSGWDFFFNLYSQAYLDITKALWKRKKLKPFFLQSWKKYLHLCYWACNSTYGHSLDEWKRHISWDRWKIATGKMVLYDIGKAVFFSGKCV